MAERDPRKDPRPGDVVKCSYFHEEITVLARNGEVITANWPSDDSLWSLNEWQHATAFDEVIYVEP